MTEPRPEDVAELPPAPETRVRWFGVVLLAGHLALLVIGAVALWRISGGGWLGAAVAGAFAVIYAFVWRYLLAPGSRTRLGFRERLTTSLILGPVAVVLGALTDIWLPALMATSIVILSDSLNESSRRR
ncbi:hypothetical protein [Tessaracoccus flavus]|uniref:Uncharacterized protein n=1 Tax=Tessaracoccus flavus TaxID=1610493 RepID=A0A1Q2CG68_9ACTN|nr:hypothetical protein [Tessaracoccus flavus]AQP45103.1 hypothetical protein RPIT_10130 [Tessaracoccus flavus]SDY56386.1 hypothetical protein SAMN05428934_102279 [Tessaracoccus flavus]